MRLLALAITLLALGIPATATAEPHKMTFEFASWVAVDYWANRGIIVPCRPTHYIMSEAESDHANDVYDGQVAMLTDPDACVIAISPVDDSYRVDPDLDWMYCADVVHEYGHLAGFADADDGGIMDLNGYDLPFGCAHPRQWTVLKSWRKPPRWVRRSPQRVQRLWLHGHGYAAQTLLWKLHRQQRSHA